MPSLSKIPILRGTGISQKTALGSSENRRRFTLSFGSLRLTEELPETDAILRSLTKRSPTKEFFYQQKSLCTYLRYLTERESCRCSLNKKSFKGLPKNKNIKGLL